MEVSAFPFLEQDDYYTNFYAMFSETENVFYKRPRLETDIPFSPLMFLNEEEQNIIEPVSVPEPEPVMSDYFKFHNYQTGTGTEPDGSLGSTGSFHFQSLAGPSGQIQFQETGSEYTDTAQNRFKRSRSYEEIETNPVRTEPVQTVQNRRLWVKNRSKAWWEEVNRPDYPEHEFVRAFRMRRSTFEYICDELDSAVTKKDTMLRQAIPVRQRVAVCIYRLATGEPLRLVSKKFGLGISTCHKLVLEVCTAIKTVLMPKFLKWPDENRVAEIKRDIASLYGIPNIIGSIYTTHIPIIAPKVSVAAYFNKKHTERNQKTSYSITVQGVVDSLGVFTDICIGWPGSMPDEKILEKSALFQRITSKNKGFWIAANKGYPLNDWILTPYTHKNMTWAQHRFNKKLEEVNEMAKGAFGRLKGRWSCLQKRTEVKLQELPIVLGACCVLHNICEMRGEKVEGEMMFEVFDDEMDVPQNGVRSLEAIQARDQIAQHLLHHNFGGSL